MAIKFDTSRLSPPKFYERLLSGSGSRQGFRSTRTSRKPNETLDAFRYRYSKMVAFGEKCLKFFQIVVANAKCNNRVIRRERIQSQPIPPNLGIALVAGE